MDKKRVLDITVVDGTDGTLALNEYIDLVYISGTDTLTGDWELVTSGSAATNMYVQIKYDANVTLSGNNIILLGTTIPTELATKQFEATALYKGGAWDVWVKVDFEENGTVGYAKLILTDSVVNADINSSAAIVYSKLDLGGNVDNADIDAAAAIEFSKMEALTASKGVKTDGSGLLVPTTVSAAELEYSAGVTSAIQTQIDSKPTSGAIVNADINASAAIDFSKMAALTASRALVTDGSGEAIVSSVTAAELAHSSGVTSAIQTQLNAKADAALVQGSLFIGSGAGEAAPVDVKADANIIIGNGTTAAPQPVTGDITITNAGVTAIGANKVNPSQLTADARTELIPARVTTESGEDGDYKIKVPFKCQVQNAYVEVVGVVGATDVATIILKNNAGTTMTTGSAITFAAGSAFGSAVDTTVTANNDILADDFLFINTSKPTVNGGKYIVSIQVERVD